MSDYRPGGQLAATGLGSIVIGGVSYSMGWWMLGIAAGIVLLGVLVVRFGYRAGRGVGDQ